MAGYSQAAIGTIQAMPTSPAPAWLLSLDNAIRGNINRKAAKLGWDGLKVSVRQVAPKVARTAAAGWSAAVSRSSGYVASALALKTVGSLSRVFTGAVGGLAGAPRAAPAALATAGALLPIDAQIAFLLVLVSSAGGLGVNVIQQLLPRPPPPPGLSSTYLPEFLSERVASLPDALMESCSAAARPWASVTSEWMQGLYLRSVWGRYLQASECDAAVSTSDVLPLAVLLVAEAAFALCMTCLPLLLLPRWYRRKLRSPSAAVPPRSPRTPSAPALVRLPTFRASPTGPSPAVNDKGFPTALDVIEAVNRARTNPPEYADGLAEWLRGCFVGNTFTPPWGGRLKTNEVRRLQSPATGLALDRAPRFVCCAGRGYLARFGAAAPRDAAAPAAAAGLTTVAGGAAAG
jgi:hypothetical protein